ncbi:DNA mismatch repair protein PMS1-like [Venturia canescens]|uniref:DNA mismatch repair protein PMS1-like n=1 Tax=Venturia canescens TaxID=32260 RepID=UPI001C9C4079|nr:DNA mismatch repair protein PMS1-like [Venturia canescens]
MADYKKSLSLENVLLELLLNSLHSEATAIAVRIDKHEKKMTVIDNGCGIPKNDLILLAEGRTKHENSPSSKTSEGKYFRSGKSLIQIRNVSFVLVIMSKKRDSPDTYGKFFKQARDPELRKLENRPSCGTTVTVYPSTEFFQWNDDIDVSRIRYVIGYLALVNTQVSFSVREDKSQSIILRIGKNQKRRKLLSILCERSLTNGQVKRVKATISRRINIEIYWGVECTSKKIHQIFLNLRAVNCPALQERLIKIVASTWPGKFDNVRTEKIFFLLYIYSPETEYELTSKRDESVVKFHEMPTMVRAVEHFFAERELAEKDWSHGAPSSSLSLRPIGRISRLGKKRSFFTSLPRKYFPYKRNGRKIHLNKFLWKECVSKFIKEQNFEVTQIVSERKNANKVGVFDSRTSHASPESNVSEKMESRTSQLSLAKTKIKLKESTPTFDVFNGENISFTPNHNSENFRTKYSEKEKPENQLVRRQESECLPISQNKNRPLNFTVLNKSYENHDISWISQRCAEKSQKISKTSQTEVEKTPDMTLADLDIDDLSTWSNWTYHSLRKAEGSTSGKLIIQKRFNFLPVHLHALLPHGKIKLTDSRDPIGSFQIPRHFHVNLRRQGREVRACTKRAFEFRLKLQSLKSMEVLSQVNREFIVALTEQDDKKLLVIIDQHAMHERIRYENLLKAYKENSRNEQFISNVLRRPIIISDFSPRDCELLSMSRNLLTRFGLNLSKRGEETLSIHAVPRCFSKRSFGCDNTRLEISVRKLLREVVEDLVTGGSKLLPSTIREAIASEACHGSIKFGDPLTPEQCNVLVSCWKDTDAPNRCAHGRPSVIPLLELATNENNINGFDFKCHSYTNLTLTRD